MTAILIYVILSGLYLLLSGAPFRVHVLSLALLFLAFPVSTWVCSIVTSPLKRAGLSLLCAMVCFLVWDATAHFVIAKAEFLEIIRNRPWAYPVVGLILGQCCPK